MDLKVEANKEYKRLEGEDNGRWKNVDNKRNPEDMPNEIQMQKTHELYCPKCFHNITKTSKLFKRKRDASSPYNEDKFTWWFVIVFSFKYPFIYIPWLYNNTPGASEPTHSLAAETPRKHILDWLWHLLVVVLVLLSAIVMWVLFSSTIPPLPPHTNGDTTIVIPEAQKLQEDVIDIHGHLKPLVPQVVEHISPSLPPSQLHTNVSSTILNHGPKKFTEDVAEIQGDLDSHVSDAVIEDRPIRLSPPPPPGPYTDESLISASNFTAEDVSEIQCNLKPHGPDVIEDDKSVSPAIKNKGDATEIKGRLKPQHVSDVDDIPVPPSPPPLLPQPHTDESLIAAPNFPAEDVPKIKGNLKPHSPDVLEEDKPVSPPIKRKGDVTEIKGRLKPGHVSYVDDITVPSSPPPLLPQPHTDESLIYVPNFTTDDVSEIQGNLKPHGPDVVEDDKPVSPPIKNKGYVTEIKGCLKPQHVSDVDKIHVPPSPPPLLPQPHTDESLISAPNFTAEDVSEIQGNLKPHGPDVVEDDKPVSPPIKSKGDVTEIKGRLKPQHVSDVDDIHVPSSPSQLLPQLHTNESLILASNCPAEGVSEIQGNLKPHGPNVLEDDKPVSPPIKNKEDVTEIMGHLKPQHESDVDDIPVPPSPPPLLPQPLTDKILVPALNFLAEDVPKIKSNLKPHGPDVLEEDKSFSPPIKNKGDVTEIKGHLKPQHLSYVDDIHVPPSPPPLLPQPHTDESLISAPNFTADDVSEIHSNLKPHGPDVVENTKPVSPPINNKGDVTEIKGRLKPQHVSDVDDIPVPPSLPPLLPQPHTDEILISAPNFTARDVSEIKGNLKPHGPEVLEEDKSFSPPIKNKGDVTEIKGRLKPQHVSYVNDIHVPPSPPPLLPQPHTDESLISAPKFTADDVSEIKGNLKPHGPDVLEDDKPVSPPIKNKEDVTEIKGRLKPQHVSDVDDIPVPPSPSPLLPQPPTDKILIYVPNFLAEDVSEIQGNQKPHVPDVLEDDIPVSSPIKNKRDVTEIKGRLKPQHVSDVDDIPVRPSLPQHVSDESLISAPNFPTKEVSEIQGNMKPHGPEVLEEDKPVSPPIKNKGDVTEIKGRLKPQHVLDVDDILVPPSPPPLLPQSDTDDSLIHEPNFPAEDVPKIKGDLKPHGHDVVEDDKPVSSPIKKKSDVTEIKGRLKPQHVSNVDDMHVPPSSPPLLPQPDTDRSLILAPNFPAEDVSEIQSNLKPHGHVVIEDDKPVSSPIKNKGDCWVHFSWDKLDFPSNMILLLIPLLLSLTILNLCWSFISHTKGTKPENIANLPNAEILQNGEAQVSTSKPEDKKEVLEGLSTPGNNTNGRLGTETKIYPPFLWKHIVVLVQIVIQTELDILKSIVYGGLVESITSFGVVSSASASGTSTLHVMALGLANLFSGLCIIIYNLYGLVTYKPFYQYAKIGHMTDEKATDPYEELLGNRNNVILHCIVVIVSFIFFGVIPPLLYGFSHKITDNGHYEAAVVIAAALVCVTSLSFSKAYAFGMDKIKTVTLYTGIAIVGSAFSLIATQYVRDLLEMNVLKLASDYP